MQVKTDSFWTNLSKYPSRQYSDVRLDKLVTAGMIRLEEAGLERNFDNVVVVLHKLFPDKFSLMSFPEYPDSIRVDNTLRLDCRHSKFLNGNRVKGFTLTTLGRIAGEETLEELDSKIRSGGKELTERRDKRRNIAVRAVTAVTQSDGFQKFTTKQFAEIKKFDVCEVLHGTLDTPEEKLNANLQVLRKYTDDVGNSAQFKALSLQVKQFLDYIMKNWGVFMNE